MALIQSPNSELLEKYGNAGPRYTSYPTAKQFHSRFTEKHFKSIAMQTNEDFIPKPLSIYVHIPFCKEVCFYCACNKVVTANRNRASTYIEYLEKEIALHGELFDKDREVEQLHFGGGTPTYLSVEQLETVILKLRENFNIKNDDEGDYSIEIDPRQIGDHSLEKLRLLGFNRISIGVQDIDIKVQKAVNRIQPIDQTKNIVIAARKNSFKSINMDLIYGLPKQTMESFSETLDSVIAMQPDRIAIYHYAHMPQLFKVQRQINDEDIPSPSKKIHILDTAIKKLNLAGYAYIGMDHFAKKTDSLFIAQQQRSLHRNFQGYTTNSDCDQLGIGASSISNLGDCYSQNHTNIDDYYHCLNNNVLPIKHGYKLDLDDCMRRHIIMQLICNFNLAYEDIEAQFHISFEDYFYNELIELREMHNDGLLDLKPKSIQVNKAGVYLIRNICSVFDKHNFNQSLNKDTFSQQV